MKQRPTFIVFLLVFLLQSASGIAISQGGETKQKQAEKAFHSQEYDKAALLYLEVLKTRPDNPKASFRLGYIYFERKQPQLAVKYLEQAYAASPSVDKELPLLLAQAYQQDHNFGQALKHYHAIFQKTNPKKKEEYKFLEKRIQECASGQNLLETPLAFEIKNLGKPLNSAFADHVPVPLNNSKEMYFTSRRQRNSKPTKQDLEDLIEVDEDIFSISLDNPQTSPVRLEPHLNTLNHDAVVSISADDKTLYLYNETNGGDIYFATKTKTGKWSAANPLPAPINSKYFEPSVCFSRDGQYAFFASDRPGGFGGLDLYITMMQPDGTWGEALNLGRTVNSEHDEDAPFLGPTEENLYFSSRGHNTMGGYDIFKTTLNGAIWGKAQNLGYPINSAFDDIYYTLLPDQSMAYFSSDRVGGFGEKDIYFAKAVVVKDSVIDSTAFMVAVAPQPEQEVVAPAPTPQPEPIVVAKPEVKAAPEFKLMGKVLDATNKKPIAGARITLTDNLLNKVVFITTADSVSGAYALSLQQGKNYGLAIEKEDYLFVSENLEVGTSKVAWNLEKDYELNKIEAGAKIVLKNIFFDSGKATLSEKSSSELENLIELMQQNPTLKVEISGHTDNKGSATLNQSLSVKRAGEVVAYLTSKGIAKERLVAKGYGFSKPIAPNTTAEGRSQNRRTEFAILAK